MNNLMDEWKNKCHDNIMFYYIRVKEIRINQMIKDEKIKISKFLWNNETKRHKTYKQSFDLSIRTPEKKWSPKHSF